MCIIFDLKDKMISHDSEICCGCNIDLRVIHHPKIPGVIIQNISLFLQIWKSPSWNYESSRTSCSQTLPFEKLRYKNSTLITANWSLLLHTTFRVCSLERSIIAHCKTTTLEQQKINRIFYLVMLLIIRWNKEIL